MNEKELLEFAAKAIGIEIGNGRYFADWGFEIKDTSHFWNPLTDDGDALRLAVKLDLAVTPYPIYNTPKHSVLAQLKNLETSRFEVMELHGVDPYAATRRAIVRAAAEIGRTK